MAKYKIKLDYRWIERKIQYPSSPSINLVYKSKLARFKDPGFKGTV